MACSSASGQGGTTYALRLALDTPFRETAVQSAAPPLSAAGWASIPPLSAPAPSALEPTPPPSGLIPRNSTLFPSSRLVWFRAAAPPFPQTSAGKLICRSTVYDLVVAPQSAALYVLLWEFCSLEDELSHQRQSFWKADLAEVSDDGSTTRGNVSEGQLLSYWWPFGAGNGSAVDTPFIQYPGPNDTVSMADVWAMDITRAEDSLSVLSNPTGRGVYSHISALSTYNGSRTSIALPVSDVRSLTLNPNKTRAYVALAFPPISIMTASVEWTGIPMDGAEWTDVRRFTPDGGLDIINANFNSQSFSSDERCLYFLDSKNLRVWGIDPLTSAGTATTPVLIAGSGSRGVLDGDGLTSSFNNLTNMAVTPDGCNIFVTDVFYGSLRWLQLDSPCSAARRVLTVERYPGLRLIRFRQSGRDLYLYVGSSDGSVTELKLNASQLHSCAPAAPPPPPPPRSNPSPAPPADSNFPSPDSSLPSSASSPSPASPTKPGGTRSLPVALIVALPLSILAVLGAAACASFLIIHKKRRHGGVKKAQQMPNLRTNSTGVYTVPTTGSSPGVAWGKDELGGGERQEGLHPLQVKQFSFAALSYCTQNFSESYRIGPGGAFGNVYWGSMEDGKALAMKVMTGDLTEGKRKMFLAEVNTLSRVHHANLIQLVGFCHEGNRSILVYPYFPGGSLFARLHERDRAVPGKASMPPLTLVERMCIAFQIAKGLAYLHEGADPPVIHRDIKSSNVLLGDGSGEKLHVVVADFGLATIGERVFGTERESVVKTSHMAGTFGYMAPEYMMGGILSEKNDVYALGIILLELLTGRKAVAKAPSGVGWETLSDWAKPMLKKLHVVGDEMGYQILDPCLRDQAAGFRFSRMVRETLLLASECIREDDQARPPMYGLVDKMGNLLNEAQIDVRQTKH
ncbi:hypothetical protein CBR_g78804 [Chara braunii]|uniref:Protein kinase domain-containing protein n=1 Tax=Chara braunii TaxID=69332 RepID=A0A388KAD9_CHABU|nr:hypothetical protein CBR_g78804 [Chara braunii]|eukprot:GBG67025.1 hypothetical protein CBR_g78804 [Chara braunii]